MRRWRRAVRGERVRAAGLRTRADEEPGYARFARSPSALGSAGCEAVRPGEVLFQGPEGVEPELREERERSGEFGWQLRVGSTPAQPLIRMRQCGNPLHDAVDFSLVTAVPGIPHADNVQRQR